MAGMPLALKELNWRERLGQQLQGLHPDQIDPDTLNKAALGALGLTTAGVGLASTIDALSGSDPNVIPQLFQNAGLFGGGTAIGAGVGALAGVVPHAVERMLGGTPMPGLAGMGARALYGGLAGAAVGSIPAHLAAYGDQPGQQQQQAQGQQQQQQRRGA